MADSRWCLTFSVCADKAEARWEVAAFRAPLQMMAWQLSAVQAGPYGPSLMHTAYLEALQELIGSLKALLLRQCSWIAALQTANFIVTSRTFHTV